MKRKSNEAYRIEAERINALRRELNDYVRTLHKPRPAGLSLYDCFSGYASVEDPGMSIAIPDTLLQSLDPAGRAVCESVVEEYRTACRICRDPQTHPLRKIGLILYTPAVRAEAQGALAELIQHLREEGDLRRTLASLTDLRLDALTVQQEEALNELVRSLLQAEALPVDLLTVANPTELYPLLDQAAETGEDGACPRPLFAPVPAERGAGRQSFPIDSAGKTGYNKSCAAGPAPPCLHAPVAQLYRATAS